MSCGAGTSPWTTLDRSLPLQPAERISVSRSRTMPIDHALGLVSRERRMRWLSRCAFIAALCSATPSHAQIPPSAEEKAGYRGLLAAAARGDADSGRW